MEEPLHATANLLFGTRDCADEFTGTVFFGVGEREVLLELLPVGPSGLFDPNSQTASYARFRNSSSDIDDALREQPMTR